VAFLSQSGLGEAVEAVELFKSAPERPLALATVQALDSARLASSLRRFEAQLLDVSALAMPLVERVQDVAARRRLRAAIAAEVTRRYGILHAAVTAPNSGYDAATLALRFRPEQVKDILDYS